MAQNKPTIDSTKADTTINAKRALKRIIVDTRGVPLGTDKDGVADHKDKELLNPQSCFPVDSTGVGSCPEPDCCRELRNPLTSSPASSCSPLSMETKFVATSKALSKDAPN